MALQTSIVDWQLVPAARFAASDDHAVVSLFGANGDEASYEIVYHTALTNTLLGLRAFQADVILMNGRAAVDLPRLNGRVILGAREQLPDPVAARAAADTLQAVLSGHRIRSWVLTDMDTEIRFSAEGGRLQLSGEPWFYFWRYGTDLMEDSLDVMIDGYNSQVETYERLRLQAQSAVRDRRLDELGRRLKAERAAIERLEVRLLRELEKDEDSLSIAEVTPVTAEFRRRAGTVARMNPAVHGASRQLMRYSALFRYVRSTNPTNWQAFLDSLEGLRVTPTIQTPNRLPRAFAGGLP